METTLITPFEVAELARLESIIDSGIASIIPSWEALKKIRDTRLYRQTHDSFEKYCKDRFGLAKSVVYRMIEAAEAMEKIGSHPVAKHITTKRQALAIGTVPIEERDRILKEISESEHPRPVDSVLFSNKPDERDEDNQTSIVPGAPNETNLAQINLDEMEDHEPTDLPPAKKRFKTAKEHRFRIWEMANMIDKITGQIQAMAVMDGGQWLENARIRLVNELNSIKQQIRLTAYYCICPACDGEKCKTCKFIGWIAKERLPYLSEDLVQKAKESS